ncbi:hypothetical protein Agub_g8382 [Astrephomene gubernaculifera]|uniref:Uncharacterized protein n=1 Tax=Astrephomene gubernaculifera TaxID=47775 RepID=A0AAD3DTH3_9CHLO|nr:hypothetical protein Agub_g8382 [Astrephomene gubernaculifera]
MDGGDWDTAWQADSGSELPEEVVEEVVGQATEEASEGPSEDELARNDDAASDSDSDNMPDLVDGSNDERPGALLPRGPGRAATAAAAAAAAATAEAEAPAAEAPAAAVASNVFTGRRNPLVAASPSSMTGGAGAVAPLAHADADVPPLLRSLLPLPGLPASSPSQQQQRQQQRRQAFQLQLPQQQHQQPPTLREHRSAGAVLEGAAAAAAAAFEELMNGDGRSTRGPSAPARLPLPPMPSGDGAAPPPASNNTGATAGSPSAEGASAAADTAGPATAASWPGPRPARRNAVAYPRSVLLEMLETLRSADPIRAAGGPAAGGANGGGGGASDASRTAPWRHGGTSNARGGSAAAVDSSTSSGAAAEGSPNPYAIYLIPAPRVAPLHGWSAAPLLRDAAFVRQLVEGLPGVGAGLSSCEWLTRTVQWLEVECEPRQR